MRKICLVSVVLAAGTLFGCASEGYVPPTSISNVVVDGQLFCAQASTLGPIVVALATKNGAPITVTDKTAQWVASNCALINAIPVVPPPTVVPTVAVDNSTIPSVM